MVVRPMHRDGANCWECPCLECTSLDYEAAVGVEGTSAGSLAEYRRSHWPEHYVDESEPCDRGTVGCSVWRHNGDTPCMTW